MVNLIHVGSLTFDAEDRETWSAMNLVGWKGSPPMRATAVDRPNGEGAFGSTKNYRSARALRLEAVLDGGDLATQQGLEDSFAAIQADGVPFVLSVENDIGTRSLLSVSLVGEAEIIPDPDFLGATVTARFIAYDPVKYGPEVEYSTGLAAGGGGLEYELGEPSGALYYGANGTLGRVEITNSGTAEIWPSIVVNGSLDDGFYVQCLDTGDIVRYDRVVPAGSTVSIDFRTGEVLIDEISDASTYLTMDQFWSIPPGGSCTVQFNSIGASSGSPTLTVTAPQGGWW